MWTVRGRPALQRAMLATKLVPHYAAMAKERQKAALVKGNKTRHEKESPVEADVPQPARRPQARDEAAKAVGVGGRTVSKAWAVREYGSDELIRAVEAGGSYQNGRNRIVTLPKLLFACMEKGVKLTAGKRGRIRANPRSEVSGAMKQAIAEHKPALLELLRGGDIDDWRMIRIKPKVDDVPEPAGGDYLDDGYVEPSMELVEKWAMEDMERERAEYGDDPVPYQPFDPSVAPDDDDEQCPTPF